uniref:PDZ domain-containing protein n=1 Tax=Meloidogyne incognita TaxID=6306 RepID=A0A914LCY8_MELIC
MSFTHSPSKQDYVTILAIYDDPPPSFKSTSVNTTIVSTSLPEEKTKKQLKLEIASNHKISNQQRSRSDRSPFIDVKSLDMPPSIGLQVQHSETKFSNLSKPHSEKNLRKHQNGEAMSVHFAPTQRKDPDKLFQEENWRQNNSRKSRIGDNFLDAKEKIDLEQNELKKWSSFLQVDPSNYRFQKIVLSPETKDLSMGLEISAVPNPQRPSHLLAVEVRKIEQRGRVAEDGQLRVCDQIVNINGTPCDQISFARARLHLRDLQSIPEPSLSFFRRINSKKLNNNSPQLEQFKLKKGENTSLIGFCKEIKLTKGEDGFGFSYAGRLNASEQHLYYIKGLRKNLDLTLGDRILQINGIDLSNLTQSEVTSLLKKIPIGETISLIISSQTEEKQQQHQNEEKENLKEKFSKNLFEELKQQLIGETFLEIIQMLIPLNETPGAGLGISVKAQRMGCNDLGLYVRSILHGSAAYKDGRLKVNDRLIGIEEVNLLNYSLNGEALDAFMGTLSQIPTNKRTVLLFIARIKEGEDEEKEGGNLNEKLKQQQHQSRWGSDSELSQKEQFVRDSVTRRSISEKRPLGQHNDPSHLRTYQRILHQRQTSAPAVSSVFRSRRSLHEPLNISSPEEPRSRKSRPRTTFYDGDCSTTKYESQTLPSPKNQSKIVCPGSYSPQRKFPSSALSSSKSQPDSLSTPKPQQKNNENGKRRGSLGSGLFKLFSRTHSCKEDSPNKNKPKTTPHLHQQQQYRQQQPPPPPYFHSPTTSPPYSAYGFWPQCFPPPPIQHSFNQNCTNHRPRSPLPSSIAPPGILPWTQSFRCPHPSFNSQLHGHGPVEVPHWRQGGNNLLRHQQIHPRRQMFPLTITTRR